MHILLVDDHALFREGMKFLLKSLEKDVVLQEAENCEDALALLEQHEFGLILLDLNLPGINRMAALAAVRELKSDTPVVVLSGEDAPALVRTAIDMGAMGFIPKSSTHDILIQAM